RCVETECDQIKQMADHHARDVGRCQSLLVEYRAQISDQQFQRIRRAWSEAHYLIVEIGHDRSELLARHPQTDKAHGRWTGNIKGALRAAQKDSITLAECSLLSALNGNAAAGQIHPEAQVVAGPYRLRR